VLLTISKFKNKEYQVKLIFDRIKKEVIYITKGDDCYQIYNIDCQYL